MTQSWRLLRSGHDAEMSIITVQIGQCGNQLGFEFFNVLSQDIRRAESAECYNGYSQKYCQQSNERFFTSDSKDGLVASAVLIDTEKKVVGKALVDACRSNQWHYAKDSCYTHQQGAGNNWASGYIEHAERGLDSIMELIRRRVERCDWLDGFLPLMSLGGGTGSGLGTKVTEALSQDYPNTPLVNIVVRPFSSGEVAVQAYNAVLSLSHLQDSSDALIVLNNDGLHHVASKRWAVKNASLSHLNIVAAQQLACLLQPSKTAEGLPTRIGDVPVELGCHSQLRLVTLLQVPQEPPHVAPFSCATWPGLVRSLHKMRLCRSSTDEAMGAEGRPLRSVAALSVARGDGLSSSGAPVPGEALFGAPSPASWTCPRRFLGRGRTLLLADNHQGCLSFLEPLLSRAWGRFTEGAFLHHYTRHGLQVEDLADAFVRLEQTLEAYRQLSGS
ncbi:tubulin delta chain [Ixodes scapularis]|uniref:tubulin delta chain n=1 Tax=Ixodes scapularis TaxID=6945 RepID=UPI001AD716EC|nr:tubulin delta chain [Ixodes scapularis]